MISSSAVLMMQNRVFGEPGSTSTSPTFTLRIRPCGIARLTCSALRIGNNRSFETGSAISALCAHPGDVKIGARPLVSHFPWEIQDHTEFLAGKMGNKWSGPDFSVGGHCR